MDLIAPLKQLHQSFREKDYRGYDPFDGLNSKIIESLPILNHNRLFRLAWIQFFKRNPLNLRKYFAIEPGYNIKGLALILSSLVMLKKAKLWNDDEPIHNLIDIILRHRATDRDYYCWGYNFPWEARAFSVPRWEPNMIVSTFTAQAFLDLYELFMLDDYLKIAIDVGEFIRRELLLEQSDEEICFGYIPGEQVKVHNANLMGAKLFARLFAITKDQQYKDYAIKSANYSVNRQREDGAWVYGEQDYNQWIDNFHTGFNLVALLDIQKICNIDLKSSINKGLEFHTNNHFLSDMTPKYYDNSLYPIDIHNFAQGVITFISFSNFEKAEKLLEKALQLMYDKDKKYFYYQKKKLYINKINYSRWAEAWMSYALSLYIAGKSNDMV